MDSRMKLAKVVLNKLGQQPLRWTPLLKATIQTCRSPPRLYYILRFLEKNGFVEHVVIKEKQHWAITERGKELRNVISESQSQPEKKVPSSHQF